MLSPTNIPANSFNLLRLLCCLIVIFEHTLVLTDVGIPDLDLRGIAVNVFFILSGFWVTQSYLACKSLGEYAGKRFIRIFPQYSSVVLCCAVLLVSFSSLSRGEYFSSPVLFKYIVANLATLNFLQSSLPGVFEGLPLNGAVNGSLWTIKVEAGFYVVLPLLFGILRRTRRIAMCGQDECGLYKGALTLLYLVSVCYNTFMPIAVERASLPSALNNQLPAAFSYFVGGMVFVFYWEKLRGKMRALAFPCLCLYALLSLVYIPFLSELVVPISLSVVVMWLGFGVRFLQRIPLGRDYSYGMYLVHYPFIMCLLDCGMFQLHWWLGLYLVIGASFFCAFILEASMALAPHRHVETVGIGSCIGCQSRASLPYFPR